MIHDDTSFFIDKVIEEIDQMEYEYQKKKLCNDIEECKDDIDNDICDLLKEKKTNYDLLLFKLDELNI